MVPPGPIGTQKSCEPQPGSSQELLEAMQGKCHHPGAYAALVQPWRHQLCLFQMQLLPRAVLVPARREWRVLVLLIYELNSLSLCSFSSSKHIL